MKVTGEQVFEAMKASNIIRVDHHKCSICDQMVYLERTNDDLYFHGSCDCASSSPSHRSWNIAAEWINMQSMDKWRVDIMKRFGFTDEQIGVIENGPS